VHPTKRQFVMGGILSCASIAAGADAKSASETFASKSSEGIATDLSTYIGFGKKTSGGDGDNASGVWIENRLRKIGMSVERQEFDVPHSSATSAVLICGDARATIEPVHPVVETSALGDEAKLAVVPAESVGRRDLQGCIAAIVLPYRRWSTASHPIIQQAITSAFNGGAQSILLVTTGPTGERASLNVAHDTAPYQGPVCVIGPNDLARILAQPNSATARLQIKGKSSNRKAFNVIAKTKAPGSRRIVVSSPRSGWGICAGERGPGIALLLQTASDLAKGNVPATLLCTSGHEFENYGGRLFLRDLAPTPHEVAFWLHLGAGFAARDWHETGGELRPLPSADPQRFLMVSAKLLPDARQAFSGLAGLEQPYPLGPSAQGELKEILSAGYTNAAGMFGAHRFHHTEKDDERCVDPEHVTQLVAPLRKLNAIAFG
jgi:hypothetical protein